MDSVSTEFAGFFAPSDILIGVPELRPFLLRRYEQWKDVVSHVRTHGILGLVLRQEHRSQWVFISEDVNSGMFRYSSFDRCGFFGHGVRSSLEKVLTDVFADGYRVIDSPETLDEVAATWTATDSQALPTRQTQGRGSDDAEYQIYLDCADNGHGIDITSGKPLKTYQEWLSS